MARVKRGVVNHARHKKILKLAKGYRGRAKSSYRIAVLRVEKGLQYGQHRIAVAVDQSSPKALHSPEDDHPQ